MHNMCFLQENSGSYLSYTICYVYAGRRPVSLTYMLLLYIYMLLYVSALNWENLAFSNNMYPIIYCNSVWWLSILYIMMEEHIYVSLFSCSV